MGLHDGVGDHQAEADTRDGGGGLSGAEELRGEVRQ